MKSQSLSVDRIIVLDRVERPESQLFEPDFVKSIEAHGIQQPLVVIEDAGKFYLAKGLKRLSVAKRLGMGKVPAAIDPLPKGEEVEAYVRRLRFVLDHHRQDLLPSQKAELVENLMQTFGMSQRQVAAYLAVDQDSITNWLAVKSYIPEVREAIDAGRMPQRSGRVFNGMTEAGQQQVWKRHHKLLTSASSGQAMKELRALYSPKLTPKLYADAEKAQMMKARGKKGERVRKKSGLSPDDKHRLMHSYEVREQELADLQKEQQQMKREIQAAIPVIGAITRNEKLWVIVPEEMRPEIERFVEIYV